MSLADVLLDALGPCSRCGRSQYATSKAGAYYCTHCKKRAKLPDIEPLSRESNSRWRNSAEEKNMPNTGEKSFWCKPMTENEFKAACEAMMGSPTRKMMLGCPKCQSVAIKTWGEGLGLPDGQQAYRCDSCEYIFVQPLLVPAPGAGEGRKDDDGKLPVHLLPTDALEAITEILDFGAKKYAPRNWEQGMSWSRVYRACLGHLWKWWRGAPADVETGKSHLWHAGCCILFLIAYELRGVGSDDRPKTEKNSSA